MRYLAIDIGSSFIKSAVLDVDACAISGLAQRAALPRLPNSNPHIYEVDPNAIFAAVNTLVESHTKGKSPVKGILLSTQTHGFLMMNGAGKALTPYISWQDHRCLDPMEDAEITYLEHLRRTADVDLMDRSGIALKPGLALSNLFAWLRRNPEARQAPGGLHFCTLGSFLIHRLTAENTCHLTNAAATGLVDIARGSWNSELIDSLGFSGIHFPRIQFETIPCGITDASLGQAWVFPDIGDHHAAILGSFISLPSEVCINIATAAQMTVISSEITKGKYEVRPFFDGQFLNTITGIPGGRCLDVLVNFVLDVGKKVFGLEEDRSLVWQRILDLTANSLDSGLVVKTGFYEGTVGVTEGAIAGIGQANFNVGEMFAAAHRNMGETYGRLIERFRIGQHAPEKLVFSGGVSRKNDPLRHAISAQIGLPGVLSPLPHEVFVGLFRLAMRISGRSRNLAETHAELFPDQKSALKLKIEER